MKTLASTAVCLLLLLGCEQQKVNERPLLLSIPRANATYVWMLALPRGQLIVQNGCVAIRPQKGDTYTLVFPPDYSLSFVNGKWQILDSFSQVVGSVGDYVELGGGETPSAPAGVSAGCDAPFWRVKPKDVRETVPPGVAPPPVPS